KRAFDPHLSSMGCCMISWFFFRLCVHFAPPGVLPSQSLKSGRQLNGVRAALQALTFPFYLSRFPFVVIHHLGVNHVAFTFSLTFGAWRSACPCSCPTF